MRELGLFSVGFQDVQADAQNGFTLVPVGDVHFNAPMFAKDVFLAWCAKWARRIKDGENVQFIGLGDYLETFSHSERKALMGVHESSKSWLDEQVESDVIKLCKLLDFTRGRWVGMLAGNHTYINEDGKALTAMIAERLVARVYGVNAAIRVCLHGKYNTNLSYDIWAHHGRGGGQLAGSTLNALEKYADGRNCDLCLMGHDHKLATTSKQVLEIAGMSDCPRIVSKRKTLVRTGSFLKAYEPGKVSYIAAMGGNPVTLGTASLRIFFTRHRVGKGEIREVKLETEVTL